MHLPQLVAIGVAILSTSSNAAPLASSSSSETQHKPLTPISYRATGGSRFGSMAPQAFFASPPKNEGNLIKRNVPRARTRSMAKRRPSAALEAVLNYVKRFTESGEEEEDDDDDDEEEDGTQPSHYYQPIGGQRNVQKPFAAKRGTNAQCGVKASTTASAKTTSAVTAKATSTSKSSTTTTSQASSTSSSKSAAATSTAPTNNAIGKGGAGLMAGYWPSWSSGTLPPENIAWSKYDIVYYAFAVPSSSGSISIDDTSLLKRFVTAAHKGNSKAVLSLGGWGQSKGFSKSVTDDSARSNFIKNVLDVISKYNLDGVDFDWEYPGNVQGGTNDPKDTGNFQTFLQQLRAKIPTGKLMSAAVPQQVWQGSNGNPVGSVARAGGALDHIVIMNYDVWGSSATPGPNAPLGNLCGNSTQPVASAAGGVKAWTSAGFPRNKILLGVPSYGYLNKSTRKLLKQRSLVEEEEKEEQHTVKREGDVTLHADRAQQSSSFTKRAALKSMDGTTDSGQINFNQLVSQGVLKLNTQTGTFDAAGGYTKYWDDCSDTPYLANGNTVVTYDDPDSLYDKADFSRLAGIAGVAMWSIDGDTSTQVLTNSLIAGLKGT